MTRSNAEYMAKWRRRRVVDGLCRECTAPAATRTLKNGTTKTLKLCAVHAAIDSARKAGAINTRRGA
jgi:hypothetical protein